MYLCSNSLSPYSFDVSPSSTDAPHFTHDSIPMGVIPVLSTITTHYIDTLNKMIHNANSVFRHFLKSEEGFGFNGNVCLIGKCGSLVEYVRVVLCQFDVGFGLVSLDFA